MLNFANLNDVEFESLCRDIMSRKLGVELRRFAPGRDGGVDLTDDTVSMNIVVQIKHYQNSDVSALVRSLKKELPKVEKLCPSAYYICCSKALTAANYADLRACFGDYMQSDSNIMSLIQINDFLMAPENGDILKKHFKLWIDSTGILEDCINDKLFVDCEVLLSDIEEDCQKFVRTEAFNRALEYLDQTRILCIIGNPGVGKSITSKMLVLHYAALGYRVRYTTDVADLNMLKSAMRRDSEAKEIILLDDCFGQAYYEMKESQGTELLSLIKYVKIRSSKILILNSRVTIYQEAKERQPALEKSLGKEEYKVLMLDMSEYSAGEKAMIFYNHLVFSGVPDSYLEEIRKDQRYLKIVEHPNYNPRIIEFVCSPKRYKCIHAGSFYTFILNHLDNPQEMWKDEYEHKLEPVDRILLQTIYSMTRNEVEVQYAQDCFERRIAKDPGIDNTVGQFDASIYRLSNGFIRLEPRWRRSVQISMCNPSINDFLDGYLHKHPLVKQEMINSICAIPQIERLIPKGEQLSYAVDMLLSGKYNEFVYIGRDPMYQKASFITYCVFSAHIFDKKYQEAVWHAIRYHAGVVFDLVTIWDQTISMEWVLEAMTPKLWDFYCLDDLFEGEYRALGLLWNFMFWMRTEERVEWIKKLTPYFRKRNQKEYHEMVMEFLSYDFDDPGYIYDVQEDDLSILRDVDIDICLGEKMSEEDINKLVSIFECRCKKIAHARLEQMAEELPQPFNEIKSRINDDNITVEGAKAMIERHYLQNSACSQAVDQVQSPIRESPDEIFQ